MSEYILYCDESVEKGKKYGKYFKLYYQFIKHSFGFMDNPITEPYHVRIYLDQMPAKKEDCNLFKQFLIEMPETIDFRDSTLRISKDQIAEIDSHDHVLLQCVDIVMGAMQFRLNDQHLVKAPGETGRGKRTISKEKLYKHINSRIQQIHSHFNIGISTGARGYRYPHWESPYEHWLFVPKKKNNN